MKLLKYFLYALLLSAVYLSCEKEDNHGNLSPDEKIIGTWQLSKLVIEGEVIELNACKLKSTEEYFEDGTFVSNYFYKIDGKGDCLEGNDTWFWRYIRENEFIINEDTTIEVNFSNNNNAMTTIRYWDGDKSKGIEYERSYIRIE